MRGYYPIPRSVVIRTHTCRVCKRVDKHNTPSGRQWFEKNENGKYRCPSCGSDDTLVVESAV